MKVAFVTGSNKGIGFAIVEKLASFLNTTCEWDVYLTARNSELGVNAVEKLKNKGLIVKFHQLDITNGESRGRFLQFMKSEYPNGISIAVNNAGIAYKGDSTAPFAEQARVTIATNYTANVDFTMEFLPLLAMDARVVHVSSKVSQLSLAKVSDELYKKMTSQLTLEDVNALARDFVRHAVIGDHEAHGWISWSYGVSKMLYTKAAYIIGDSLEKSRPDVVMNVCCPGYVDTDMTSHKGTKTIEEGGDTPFYLATLPIGVTEPVNKFVSERQIVQWSKGAAITW